MKNFTFFVLMLLSYWGVVAQTVLGPGDLAFIGTNSDGATYDQDTFAFVLLKDIDAATQIKFTDRGWNDASGFFDTPGDSQFTWTSGIERSVGDIIVLDGTNLYPASYSTIGDQIFAYQGLDALPVFIAGLHTNVTPGSTDSNWDGAATSNSTSALPDQLENGLNAMRFTTEYDNGQYSAISAGGNSYASLEEILAKVNNLDNWNFSNTTSYNPPAEPGIEFVLPAPCIAPENAVLSLSANNVCPGSSTTINISGNLNDAAEWVIYTDSCGGNEIGRTTGASFEVTPPNGNTTYYVRGEDGTGCVDETIGSCATITVNVEDNTPPSIACPSDIEIDNDAGTTVTYSSPLATDNCNIPQPAKANFTSLGGFNGKFYYLSNDSFNPEGAFSDAESNGGNVVAINDASENNFVNSSLSTSGLGTVMIGFTDIASEGNFVWRNGEAVSYTNWNTNEPNNSNNEDYTELIISNGKWNDFPNYTRRYILETNQATQTAGLPSGSEFPIGITKNTFEITDASGNKSTCSFNVTVNDVEAPAGYTVSIDQAEIDENNQTSISFTFANAEVGTTYNYTFSSDNGGTNATGSGAIASATDQITGIDLSDLEDGDITLSVTLTDASLNEGTEVTDSKLKATNEAPVAVCKSFTAQLDASGNVTISPNDIDGGSSDDKEGFILSISQETFDCSNIGDNTVELTITDSNDLKDTCTATVTVEDNVAPIAIAKDITVQLDANGTATIAPADIDNGSNDACGIASLSLDTTEFTCKNVGPNTVTLTVVDNNQNETTATAKVTVEDNVAPVAVAKDFTVQLDANGTATIAPADIDNGSNDACGIAGLSLDITEFSCEDVGGNIVTLTVVDNNQNETTATAKVTVEDTIAPIPNIADLEDIIVKCEVFPGRITAPTAKDNCSELTATTSDPLTYNEIGSYVITWSFDDGNGNTTIQKQKVIVEPSPLNAVTFDDASFEYNGDAHSLEVKNLPETASVEYSIVPETGIQNGAIKAGVYTVTANLFSGTETCPDAQLTATLTIDKAEAEISADAVQTFVYDGTVKNIVANLNHSETELTYTPQKGFIEPGTYEIMVNSVETENYFATSKEVTLVIEKAEFTGVSFADNTEAFVYNGTEHSIFVSGLPEGATVEYTNNGQTNAGTYLVTAKVSKPGYKDLVLTANMVINKASQSITFDELEDRNQLSDEHFQLNAVSTSGLPVIYSYTYESENPAATVGPRGFVRILGGGQITITARQEGNQNYEAATPVVRTLTINGSEARLVSASINGTTYNDPNVDIYYLIGCGSSENEVQIELEPNQGSSIDSQNIFTVNTPTPGIYRRTLVVTSGDGNVSTTYNIIIEKNFNFEDIVIQKFNNVLLVNNNPETNGGYKFVSFRWYKNGSVIGNDQYYSVGNNTGDQLDADASYYVVLETEDGEVLRTCISSVQLKSSLNVSLAPNPVNSGGTVELLTDFPEEELETMHLSIHNLNGGLIQQMKSNSKSTNITLPYNLEIGVYILKIETKSIYKSLKFIVK